MLPLVLLAQVSCKIYDDEDSLQEPAYMVVQQTYRAYVNDLFRMVELADFYRSYREIWQDREASMQLADSYFPEGRVSEDGLYYEMADVSGWGVIKAGNDGTYTIKSYGDYSCYVFRNYYGYESMNYEVTVSADGYFSIKSVDPEDDAGNDSILKIDSINELRKEGMPLFEAIHTAGIRRLRAIVMTTLTTIFAMVPLLFTSDIGSELQRPLSIAMIGAMTVGVIISLFIVPLIYWFVYKKEYERKKF